MKRVLLIINGIIIIWLIIDRFIINSNRNERQKAFYSKHNFTDSNFVLLKSETSPNNKFKFVEYQFDNGAFGYSRLFWSVVDNDPNIQDLEKGVLPDGYKVIEWSENSELVIEKWEPYYFKKEDIILKSGVILNGVKLKLKK